jgi:hypothetical protein
MQINLDMLKYFKEWILKDCTIIRFFTINFKKNTNLKLQLEFLKNMLNKKNS